MSDETERPLIEVARDTLRRDQRRTVATDPIYAQGFVDGHEEGLESAFAGRNAAYVSDLDRTVDMLNKKDARIAELEAQLAARPAVTGVVVTKEMCELFAQAYWDGGWWSTAHPNLRHAVRDSLTAALRTATTVPLASAEVALHETATRGTTPMRTPLYRGISEPAQRGEASDAES